MHDTQKITAKQWKNAVDNVKTVLNLALKENEKEYDFIMILYISTCKELLKRYKRRERTHELYEEMINLE